MIYDKEADNFSIQMEFLKWLPLNPNGIILFDSRFSIDVDFPQVKFWITIFNLQIFLLDFALFSGDNESC